MKAILVEVNGNETSLVSVEGAENEKEARLAAYRAMFGEAADSNDEPTDETLDQYTNVLQIYHVKL